MTRTGTQYQPRAIAAARQGQGAGVYAIRRVYRVAFRPCGPARSCRARAASGWVQQQRQQGMRPKPQKKQQPMPLKSTSSGVFAG